MCDGFEECALAIHKNCNISAMFICDRIPKTNNAYLKTKINN